MMGANCKTYKICYLYITVLIMHNIKKIGYLKEICRVVFVVTCAYSILARLIGNYDVFLQEWSMW